MLFTSIWDMLLLVKSNAISLDHIWQHFSTSVTDNKYKIDENHRRERTQGLREARNCVKFVNWKTNYFFKWLFSEFIQNQHLQSTQSVLNNRVWSFTEVRTWCLSFMVGWFFRGMNQPKLRCLHFFFSYDLA